MSEQGRRYKWWEDTHRVYFRVGPVEACKVPSWDAYGYPRFGAWRHGRGLTLRYRRWLLVLR